MFYSIRHLTQFRYDSPREREHDGSPYAPTNGGLAAVPERSTFGGPARARQFVPRLSGNSVHHFDVPGKHTRLMVIAESLVEVQSAPDLPQHLVSIRGHSSTPWSPPETIGKRSSPASSPTE